MSKHKRGINRSQGCIICGSVPDWPGNKDRDRFIKPICQYCAGRIPYSLVKVASKTSKQTTFDNMTYTIKNWDTHTSVQIARTRAKTNKQHVETQ